MALFYCLIVLVLAVASGSCLSDEEILKWEAPEYLKKEFPYYLSGVDNDGAEVWIFHLGEWEFRPIAEEGGTRLKELKQYLKQMYIRIALKHKDSEESKHAVAIADMDGLTHAKAFHAKGLAIVLEVLRGLEEYSRKGGYKKGIIVNVTPVFEAVYSVARPFLGDLSKLAEIYGTNSGSWKPKLLKSIPKDQLPERFGGSKDHKYISVFG